jgi:hypothetical protein
MQLEPVCANCEIPIRWQPTIVDGQTFCCLGCAEGGPCKCDYGNLPRLGEVKALVPRRAGQFESHDTR